MVIIKRFASYLSIPLCDIINKAICKGKWPDLYKIEAITPIPKQYPPTDVNMLRPISLLYFFERTMESLIGDLMINDMKANMDHKQFGNRKKTSINHYLLKMINRIVTCLDENKKRGNKCSVVPVCWLSGSFLKNVSHFGCQVVYSKWSQKLFNTLSNKLFWR